MSKPFCWCVGTCAYSRLPLRKGLVAIVHRNHFFHLYQQKKSSESKVKFRQTSNSCKRVLEAAKLAYATKIKESITSQKPGSQNFWRIANSVLNKGKSAIPPLFNGPEVLSSASDKAKLFAKNFSKNSNLNYSGVSLPVFPSRTNVKLYNISITPKMIKKVITNFDLSKASGPYSILALVLKNCIKFLSLLTVIFFIALTIFTMYMIILRKPKKSSKKKLNLYEEKNSIKNRFKKLVIVILWLKQRH